MKRILVCLLALCLLTGAWGRTEEETNDVALEIALNTAEKLVKLISMEEYIRLNNLSGEIEKLVRSFGGDWVKEELLADSKTVYVPKIVFSTVLSAALLGADASLKMIQYDDYMMQTMAMLPLNLLNSRVGVTAIAASSAARYSEIRCIENIMPGVTYVLLDFGQEHPYIFVTFIVAEDHAATVNAAFLMTDHETAETLIHRFTTAEGLTEILFSN